VCLTCAFKTKSFVIWEPSVLKSRFLLNNIRDTAAWNPWMFFATLQSPAIIWPRDPPWGSWNIVMDKKLLYDSYKVYYMVQIPIKSDQISPCISNIETKKLDKIKHDEVDFQLLISRQNPLLFENQVCWKADFCFTASLLVYYTNHSFICMDYVKNVTYLKISEVCHCL